MTKPRKDTPDKSKPATAGPGAKEQASSIDVHCAFTRLADIAELIPNPRNPNKHGDRQIALLAKIIRHQGWRSPVVVSKRSGFVVSGHGRLEAAKLLQVEKVPVDFQDFDSDADEWAHLVADNRIAELAEIDDNVLNGLLAELQTTATDMDFTGFDADALAEALSLEAPKVDAPPKENENELLKKWEVERGQLWMLGDHFLLCDDALDPDNWRRLGGPFLFCFADPPYELTMTVSSLRGATKMHLLFMATDKVMQSQDSKHFRTMFCYIFDSAGSAPWTTIPLRKHTLVGWFCFGDPGKMDFRGVESVIKHDGGNQEASEHGQAKPAMLPEYFINAFTKRGEEFADAFCGSGASIIAAQNTGRKCRGIELSPAACAVALERFFDATGITPTLAW